MTNYVALEDVAEVNPKPPKVVDDAQEVSFLPMAAISENGFIAFEEKRLLKDVRKGFTYFERGDFLIAKITPCFENGKAALTCNIKNNMGYGSTEFHVVRADKDKLDKRYLYYLLWSNQFRFFGKKEMRGAAGQKRITTDFLRGYKIPLPPLEEQKCIAAILDKADALRRKRQQAIDLTDQLLRSVFLDMFGDPAANPKGWNMVPIGSISDVKTGGTPSRNDSKNFGGDIPWVKTTEVDGGMIYDTGERITEKGLRTSNCVLFPSSSILVAMYGQGKTRGRSAMLGIPATTNQACAVILPNNEINQYYLREYIRLSYDQIRELGRGGNQPNLNLALVKGFEVFIPPLDLQNKFVDRVNKINKTCLHAITSKKLIDELFHSLTQQAFRGELTKQIEVA